MSKFLVERTAAGWLGNTCATCNTHKHDDGFVNTNLDVTGRGRAYICAGCVREMAREVGCLDPQQAQQLRNICDEITAAAEKAQSDLAAAKENMVVPLAEVIDFLAEREARRPAETKPATVPA